MNFKIVISDPKTKKSYQLEKEQNQTGLVGKKIGEKISGDGIGLQGYKIEVTGGSDRQGFPMRRDVEGAVRKKILLSMPPGFHPKIQGQRKRKSIRGNTLSSDIVQVNIKVVKEGSKKIEELLGVKAKEKKPEEKKEAKPEDKKEAKPEGKDKPKEVEEKPEKSVEEKMGIKKLEDTEEKK